MRTGSVWKQLQPQVAQLSIVDAYIEFLNEPSPDTLAATAMTAYDEQHERESPFNSTTGLQVWKPALLCKLPLLCELCTPASPLFLGCLCRQDSETTSTHLVRQQARLLPQDGLRHPANCQLALIVHLQQQGLELGWTAKAGSGVSAHATELLGVVRLQEMTQQSLEVTVERQPWHASDACMHKLSVVYLQIQMPYYSPTGQSLGSGSAGSPICWVECKQGNSVLASVLTFEKQGSIKFGENQGRRILHLGLLNGVEVRSHGLALVALCTQPGTAS